MTKPTNNPAPHAGEKNPLTPKDGQTPGMAQPPAESAPETTEDDKRPPKQPSREPSFSSTEDEPLATAGTGGSEDPKGRVRPGGGEVPADTKR